MLFETTTVFSLIKDNFKSLFITYLKISCVFNQTF